MDSWIGEQFKKNYDDIVSNVERQWKDPKGPAWYTPHGPEHNRTVEKNIKSFCPFMHDRESNNPNDIERFILSASA